MCFLITMYNNFVLQAHIYIYILFHNIHVPWRVNCQLTMREFHLITPSRHSFYLFSIYNIPLITKSRWIGSTFAVRSITNFSSHEKRTTWRRVTTVTVSTQRHVPYVKVSTQSHVTRARLGRTCHWFTYCGVEVICFFSAFLSIDRIWVSLCVCVCVVVCACVSVCMFVVNSVGRYSVAVFECLSLIIDDNCLSSVLLFE